MFVNLRNTLTGEVRTAKIGFSWTFFFFGWLVPLFRTDWKWFVLTLVIGSFTFGLSSWVFMFIYNKIYISELLMFGWEPASDVDYDILRQRGFIY